MSSLTIPSSGAGERAEPILSLHAVQLQCRDVQKSLKVVSKRMHQVSSEERSFERQVDQIRNCHRQYSYSGALCRTNAMEELHRYLNTAMFNVL